MDEPNIELYLNDIVTERYAVRVRLGEGIDKEVIAASSPQTAGALGAP